MSRPTKHQRRQHRQKCSAARRARRKEEQESKRISEMQLAAFRAAGVHIFVRGDTLEQIAQRYGLSLEELYQLNENFRQLAGDDPGEALMGYMIRIPPQPAPEPMDPGPALSPLARPASRARKSERLPRGVIFHEFTLDQGIQHLFERDSQEDV